MNIQRKSTEEKFSSFLIISGNYLNSFKWETMTPLKINIKKLLEKYEQYKNSEDELAQNLFLELKTLNSDNILIKNHLIAYLQEPCYWSATRVHQRLKNIMSSFNWEEYFQSGNLCLADPLKLLRKYQSNLGSKLSTYAQGRLESEIANQMFALMQWKRASDWGLLRKVSQRRRKELIINLGFEQLKTEQFLLVWNCYEQVYTLKKDKKNRSLSAPSEQQFQNILNLYTELSQQYEPPLGKISLKELKTILNTCITTARQYYNPKVVSPPEHFDLAAESKDLLSEIETEEEEGKISRCNQSLQEAIALLPCELQLIMKLWKGLQLTQQDIVRVIEVNYPGYVTEQYQVARKLDSFRTQMLKKLAQEYQTSEKLTKETLIEFKAILDLWLQDYYQKILTDKLKKIYQQNLTASDLKLKLAKAITPMLSLPQPNSLEPYLDTFIENWLSQQKG